MKKIRWGVFLPPWILMVVLLVLNLTNYDVFVSVMDTCTSWILNSFTGIFCLIALMCVILVAVSYFTPVGKIKIGGADAEPIVNYKNYTWIVLCTILAAGILLWACAEPVIHMYNLPSNMSADAESSEAINWAMKTMFLEWTITPISIYGLPAMLFAFVFYNMKQPFSLGSMLVPAVGEKVSGKLMPVVDAICLFALCAGMAGSLGQGVLLISGGVESLTGGAVKSAALLWAAVTGVIVVMFIISASSGVTRGIKKLSSINFKLFLVMGIFVFIFGPTVYIIDLGIESLGQYIGTFFQISLFTGASGGSEWVSSWPGFYWCSWLSWMPVTAVFLGKISKGYTVRQMIRTIILIPSAFTMFWIMIFSGTSIYYQLQDGSILSAITASGTEAATYAVFDYLPLTKFITALFLLIVLMSFVTAADSNTNAMSSLCTTGLTVDDTESSIVLKIIWGVTIGGVCLIMLMTYGVDGVKKISNLGGLPAALLIIFFMISWVKVMMHPEKYSKV